MLKHSFDITTNEDTLDLFAEELPEQVQLLSDCLSTARSLSCCGTTGCFSCLSSIVSCGDTASK
jgi:hypothetical protein